MERVSDVCDRDDHPPYDEPHPDQMSLADMMAAPDPQPAERVKCAFPGCRFYATATFTGPTFEPRCDHHATAKVQAVARAMGYQLVARA